MKKRINKLLSLALALLMLAGMFPASAFAADGGEERLAGELSDYVDEENRVLDDSPKMAVHAVLGDSIAAGYASSAYIAHAGGLDIVADGEIIPGTYAQIVSDYFGAEGRSHARCGWRTNEFLRVVNGQMAGDAISDYLVTSLNQITDISILQAETLSIPADIQAADFVTVSFGLNDILTYALFLTLNSYGGMLENVPDLSASGFAGMFSSFLYLMGNSGDLVQLLDYFLSACEDGLNSFKANLPAVMDYIHAQNPEADIYFLGLCNPLNLKIEVAPGIKYDLRLSIDRILEKANTFAKGVCAGYSNCYYVDTTGVPYYGIDDLAPGEMSSEDMWGSVYALIRVVHPSDEGQREIANRIISTVEANFPRPVVSVTATALNHPKISWNKVSGASSYRVYRSKQTNKGYELIDTALLTSHTDLGAKVSDGYYYVVVAVMNSSDTSRSAGSDPVHIHAKGKLHEAKEPSCGGLGNIRYYDCVASGCELKFDDKGNTIEGDVFLSNEGMTHHIDTVLNGDEFGPDTAGYHGNTCTVCGELVYEPHSFDQQVVNEKYVLTAPTYTQSGIYYTSCVCGAKGSETFEVPPLADTPAVKFIKRLYTVCLGREASDKEIDYYLWLIDDQGKTGVQVANEFIFSEEFRCKNYCDKHFVIALYEAFMGREPSEQEITHWAWRLQQGDRREDVFNSFATSKEFGEICAEAGIERGDAIEISGKGTHPGGYCKVEGCTSAESIAAFAKRLYTVSLNREPSQKEIDAWHYNLVHGDHTGTSAAKYFLFSNEFLSRGYDDGEFIRHLYAAMLDRQPKDSELEAWLWKLSKQGLSREQAFEEFAASDEFSVICKEYNVVK